MDNIHWRKYLALNSINKVLSQKKPWTKPLQGLKRLKILKNHEGGFNKANMIEKWMHFKLDSNGLNIYFLKTQFRHSDIKRNVLIAKKLQNSHFTNWGPLKLFVFSGKWGKRRRQLSKIFDKTPVKVGKF